MEWIVELIAAIYGMDELMTAIYGMNGWIDY